MKIGSLERGRFSLESLSTLFNRLSKQGGGYKPQPRTFLLFVVRYKCSFKLVLAVNTLAVGSCVNLPYGIVATKN